MSFLDELPLSVIALLCVTLGLAPFTPPHVLEKLQMLASGTLRDPVDIFDLVMHGAPWVVLIAKLLRLSFRPKDAD